MTGNLSKRLERREKFVIISALNHEIREDDLD